MIPITELVAELYARGVRLRHEHGKLAYDAPRGALTPDDLATLRARKPELLEFLRQAAVAGGTSIPRRRPDAPRRLSFAQQRLWFLAQLEGPSGTYNMQTVLRLRGELHPPALARALDEVVRRHEVLRTRFEDQDGTPRLVVDPPQAVALPVTRLEALPPEVQATEVAARMRAEAERPIDLRTDPMLRPCLLELGPRDHVLVLTVHHIASDGWSIGVMLRELSLAYAAFVADPPGVPDLPPLPIQYADYAGWQREWLVGERLAQQLAFWTHYLADAPPLLRLPTDFERPAQQTYRGAYATAAIPPALVAELEALSRRADATLFMTMLAAFMTLLHRHSGQDDVLLGTHIANRTRQEVEPLVGFFVNTLALRADFSGAPSFTALLAQMKGVVETAYEYQDLPYEMLVEELRPQRNASYSPLCQVTFAMQTALGADVRLPGLDAEILRREGAPARFDLTLGISQSRAGLECTWRYNTDLFDAGTIEVMAAQLDRLLRAVCEQPDVPLAALPLRGPDEPGGAATPLAADPVIPLPERLAAVVARRPEATALLAGDPAGDPAGPDARLDYRSLGEQVDRLAAVLHGLGVGPEVRVAVCVERSPRTIVAALAVLRAGGTYVPIEPEYPPSRRRFVLEDSGSRLLVTERALSLEGEGTGVPELRLDEPWPAAAPPRTWPALHPLGGAYLMYTSGSTGQAKGAVITHESLGRYCVAIGAAVGVDERDVYLHTASFGFSSSIRQLVVPLACGASVVVASAEQRRDPLALLELVRRHGVTVLDLVPSQLRSLVETLGREGGPPLPLRRLLSASEPLPPALVLAWEQTGQTAAVHNMYGQTETTGIVTTLALPRGTKPPGSVSVRVGRPLDGARVYVLDAELRPTPVGVPGEIYVGGPTVARGYLGRPGLTADRLLPDPFSPAPGARMYRTGDRGRFAADGTLEHLERTDHQVKIRGHRIEPAEVEATLLAHPDVAEAAVVVDGSTGEARLVAYAAAKPKNESERGSEPAAGVVREWPELLEHARRTLPAYMVPALLLRVDRLPRTASGKLDRAALPRPDGALARRFVAPRDALEHAVAEIWREVLGLALVGVTDSFFDLGGHSLLAVRLLARIQRRLGRRLPLTALFENQTIEALARRLRREPMVADDAPAAAGDCLVALRSTGSRPPLFFVPGGGGSALYLHHLARYLHPEQPLYGLQPPGVDGSTPPLRSVEAVATALVERMRAVQPAGPYRLAGHSFGGKVVLEMAQLLLRAGQEVALMAVVDTGPWRDQDLSTGDVVLDMVNYLDAMAGFTGGTRTVSYDELAALDDEGRILAIKHELERLGFLPSGVETHEVRGLLDVLFASSHAANVYAPTELHPVPVSLFSAGSHSEAEHARQAERWGAVGPVELFVVPGTHSTLMAEPNVARLAERLTMLLDRSPSALAHS